MGNYLSSSSGRSTNSYQVLREQVKGLGDKYPFGDDEILRIARCLAYLRHKQRHANNDVAVPSSKEVPQKTSSTFESISFLNDWAAHCSTLPPPTFNNPAAPNTKPFVNLLRVDPNLILSPNENDVISIKRKKMKHLVKFVEEEILPNCFGQILEETLFALLTPPQSQEHTTASSGGHLAMQRLEKFLNGLADASRRGSRKSLTVIYDACAAIESRDMAMEVEGHNVSSSDGTDAGQAVSAKKLIDLSYRLSLASLVIGMVMKQTEEENNDTSSSVMDEKDENENETEAETDNDTEFTSGNNNDIDASTAGGNSIEAAMIDTHDIERINIDDSSNKDGYNIFEGFDLSPFRPQAIDKSLVQSLVDYASNYSSPLSSAGGYGYTNAFSYVDANSHGYGGGGGGVANSTSTSGKKQQQSNNENDKVSLEAFTAWAEANAPCLSSSIETFMHYIFFPDKPYPPSRTELVFPSLRGQQSAFFKSKSSSLLFTFAAMSPSLSGAWFRLYTSDEDGLSFNRLQNSLLGYSGPTLLIIRETESGGIFGAFTSTAWKETKDFYGNSDCFLFQVQPKVKVIRPRGRGGSNYMYCNSFSRSKGYDGQAHGIGFGGTIDKPRLFIAESFDGCIASASDLTFEAGALLPPPTINNNSSDIMTSSTNRKYFEIEALEVWGVGGDDLVKQALGARSQQREIAAANIRKARKVDKAAFLDDLKSGLIESKAFKHRDEIRGRGDCDCPIDDSEQKNYVYEK